MGQNHIHGGNERRSPPLAIKVPKAGLTFAHKLPGDPETYGITLAGLMSQTSNLKTVKSGYITSGTKLRQRSTTVQNVRRCCCDGLWLLCCFGTWTQAVINGTVNPAL